MKTAPRFSLVVFATLLPAGCKPVDVGAILTASHEAHAWLLAAPTVIVIAGVIGLLVVTALVGMITGAVQRQMWEGEVQKLNSRIRALRQAHGKAEFDRHNPSRS